MKSYSNNPHTVYNGMASSQRNMFVTATLATALIKFSDTFDDKLVKFNIKIISLIIFMMSIYFAISSSYDFLYYLNKNENLPDNIPKNKQIEYDAIKADRAETKLRDSMMSADALILKDQKVALDKMSERLQANGQVATDNKEFNDAAHKLKMDEFKFRMSNATNKGAQEEIAKERKAEMEKNGTFLEKISVGITSIGMNMKDKAKAAAGGLMKILKGTLLWNMLGLI